MTRTARTARLLALAAGTALGSASLTGCATHAAPRADLSASRAEAALKRGASGSAIANAEAAVLADPHSAAYRMTLGAAYLNAGRFMAARTSFDDAMELGDTSARTALGYALASIGAGDTVSAMDILTEWSDVIPAADLGLALALAGDTHRGVAVLSNAVRGGDATPKARQNLAYALALQGNWASARIMAAEDVPADQLDARLAQWAELAQAGQPGTRVAALLGVRAISDAGQPAALALANNPTTQQLAAEAAGEAAPAQAAPAAAQVAYSGGELPAVGAAAAAPAPSAPAPAAPAAPQPAAFATAFAAAPAPVQMAEAAAGFVAQPLVQPLPVRAAPMPAAPRRAASTTPSAAPARGGQHLVQLGSFSTDSAARRAWGVYAKRFAGLTGTNMVITRALVRGKTYYRVSAGGLQRAQAGSVCASVRAKGNPCFAWSQGRPMPGGIAQPVRMAAR